MGWVKADQATCTCTHMECRGQAVVMNTTNTQGLHVLQHHLEQHCTLKRSHIFKLLVCNVTLGDLGRERHGHIARSLCRRFCRRFCSFRLELSIVGSKKVTEGLPILDVVQPSPLMFNWHPNCGQRSICLLHPHQAFQLWFLRQGCHMLCRWRQSPPSIDWHCYCFSCSGCAV